jgi:hypothetical protein
MGMLTILENEHRVRSLYVDRYRIDVHENRDRSYKIGTDVLRDLDLEKATAWEILARVSPAIAVEEDKRDALEELAQRAREGWTPTPGKVVLGVRQRTLRNSTFAVDAIAYPESSEWYSPATKLMGTDTDGNFKPSDTILWIAADRSWAICEDGLYWLPAPEATDG